MKHYLAKLRDHHFIKTVLSPDSVVLDLGANEGDFSRGIAEMTGCTCHAVEASPQLFKEYKPQAKIQYYNYALGADNNPQKLFIADRTDSNSVIRFRHLEDRPFVEVPGKTLASLVADLGLKDPDLVKVDIEGAEIAVFDSTGEEILRRIGQLTVEFHDFVKPGFFDDDIRKIKQRMRRLGFVAINFSAPDNHSDVLFFNKRYRRFTSGLVLKIYVLKYAYLPLKSLYKKFRQVCLPKCRPVCG